MFVFKRKYNNKLKSDVKIKKYTFFISKTIILNNAACSNNGNNYKTYKIRVSVN